MRKVRAASRVDRVGVRFGCRPWPGPWDAWRRLDFSRWWPGARAAASAALRRTPESTVAARLAEARAALMPLADAACSWIFRCCNADEQALQIGAATSATAPTSCFRVKRWASWAGTGRPSPSALLPSSCWRSWTTPERAGADHGRSCSAACLCAVGRASLVRLRAAITGADAHLRRPATPATLRRSWSERSNPGKRATPLASNAARDLPAPIPITTAKGSASRSPRRGTCV